jgi:hypothetical protein
MQRRTSQHEVGAGDTDLRAILHEADEFRSSMVTAFLQAMRDSGKTNGVTVQAVGNGFSHGGHRRSPLFLKQNDARKH